MSNHSCGALLQDGRGERAEALAELDLEVHRRLHRRRPGVAQDAPGAQGPRAELHPALEPADDLAVGQQAGDVLEQLGLVVANRWPRPPCPARNRAISSVLKRGPRKLPLLGVAAVGVARLLQELMPDEQGRAQRAAGVAGRGLDPEVVERPLAEQPAVGHAVERDAAGQDQVLHARSARGRRRPIRSTTSSVTAWMLAARSMCRCSSGDSGRAGRAAEEVVEPPAGHRQPLAVVEVIHVEPEAAVGLEVDQALEDQVLVDRPAVGGQAHQLVFAAVDLEAAVIGERRIEQAERVRETRCGRSAGSGSPRRPRRWPCSTRRRRRG